MYFVPLVLTLTSAGSQVLTTADSMHIHAALLRTISEVDGVLGQRLHDQKRYKDFSHGIADSREGTASLRICFVAQDGLNCAQLLIAAITKKGVIQIGQTVYKISGVTIENGPWSGISTWTDITASSAGQRLKFRFVTPTAISKCSKNGARFFSLLPDPVDVFSGLVRRWSALEGPPLPDDLADILRAGGCVVSNHDLRTVQFRTAERTQIGFVGPVTYECRHMSQAHLAALQGLTRLAFFTGIGYQTARGMGLTQTSIEK